MKLGQWFIFVIFTLFATFQNGESPAVRPRKCKNNIRPVTPTTTLTPTTTTATPLPTTTSGDMRLNCLNPDEFYIRNCIIVNGDKKDGKETCDYAITEIPGHNCKIKFTNLITPDCDGDLDGIWITNILDDLEIPLCKFQQGYQVTKSFQPKATMALSILGPFTYSIQIEYCCDGSDKCCNIDVPTTTKGPGNGRSRNLTMPRKSMKSIKQD